MSGLIAFLSFRIDVFYLARNEDEDEDDDSIKQRELFYLKMVPWPAKTIILLKKSTLYPISKVFSSLLQEIDQ
jgi:hypothetical protein